MHSEYSVQSSRPRIFQSIPEPPAAIRTKINAILLATLATTSIGILYQFIQFGVHSHAAMVGGGVGFLIGAIGLSAEVFLFKGYLRRLRFSVLLLLRTCFYVLITAGSIITVAVHHLTIMEPITFFQGLRHPQFQEYIAGGRFFGDMLMGLAAIFSINFIRQLSQLLGQNVLLYYLTGKYHQPVEENRIFMFLDLKSSTTIAERLGAKQYHRFLNDFFFDITPAIVDCKGRIYQYVGDEVVITWTEREGLEDANCIKCYFRIAIQIHLLREKYMSRYGLIPEFKAGYHYGSVIAGEIGDVKKEIVFHGDTVNTAARIRSECTTFNKDLLLSSDLLSRISIEHYLTPERIGKIKLRGREEEVELFSIKEAA